MAELLKSSGHHGDDAARGVYADLVAEGILDPAKGVRVALENPMSVAGALLLTEATMIEVATPATEDRPPAEFGLRSPDIL
ncbi:hypothetical protein [Limimaricola soesokkakensis]|uniref:hypothetical protein n=1 Tax=Limimaricola soesokkakensis TaxID=1343159 RepID=UPI003516ADA1